VLLLLLPLLSLLLLILFVLVEDEFESRMYCTVRTITIEYRIHGSVASVGTKSSRRTTCNGRLTR